MVWKQFENLFIVIDLERNLAELLHSRKQTTENGNYLNCNLGLFHFFYNIDVISFIFYCKIAIPIPNSVIFKCKTVMSN